MKKLLAFSLMVLLVALVFLGCEEGKFPTLPGSSNGGMQIGDSQSGFYYYDRDAGVLRNITEATDEIKIHASFTSPAYVWQTVQSVYWVPAYTWLDIMLSGDGYYEAPYDSILIGINGVLHPLTALETDLTGNHYKFKIVIQNEQYVVVNWTPSNQVYYINFYHNTPDSADAWEGSNLNWGSMVKKWPTRIPAEGGSGHLINLLDQSGTVLPLDTLGVAKSYDALGNLIDTFQLLFIEGEVLTAYLNPDGTWSPRGDSLMVPINPGGG